MKRTGATTCRCEWLWVSRDKLSAVRDMIRIRYWNHPSCKATHEDEVSTTK